VLFTSLRPVRASPWKWRHALTLYFRKQIKVRLLSPTFSLRAAFRVIAARRNAFDNSQHPNQPGEKKRRFSSIQGPVIRDDNSSGPVNTGGYIGSHGATEIFGNLLFSGLFRTFKGIHIEVLLHPAVQLYQL